MTRHLRTIILLLSLTLAGTTLADTKYYWVGGLHYAINTDDSTAQVVRSGYYDDITSVSIPASITVDSITYPVTSLGESCFVYCTKLASVTIPASVRELEANCFSHCISLAEIDLPSSVTKMGDRCFNYCTALRSITIPDSVTELAAFCFAGCDSLRSIVLPRTLKRIGGYCFAAPS